MRRLKVWSILSVYILAVALVICVYKETYAAAAQKVYGFKSAEIELKTVAPMSNVTTEIVRIDKWGEYEARHSSSTIKMLGIIQKHESISYTDRNKNVVYNYDPETNQATRIDLSAVMKDMKKGNRQYVYTKKALKEWGGKKIRTEDFLGLKCDVIEFAQFFSTVWLYKNFPLKSETNMGAMKVKTEAVRFDEGASISKKDIMLPKGATVVDAPDIGNIMSNMNAGKDMPDMEKAMEAMQKMFENQGQ
ncbi:MAG: hypothetical protein GY941_02880 [Planctomycetes bacterium]|nr:hypothetical protein [Planctomycetota bacterium]